MMKTIKLLAFVCAGLLAFSSCDNDNDDTGEANYQLTEEDLEKVHHLTPEMVAVRNYVPDHAVIAHRGTSHWAPESTEAAYRWARNVGADYLEADLQITADGVILVVHDDILTRTSNIKEVYPDRATDPASTFTYEELMKLDAGTWFNIDNPELAREKFTTEHQYISTLEDLIMISEGYRLKRDAKGERIWSKDANGKYVFEYEKDTEDNGNRPGIYIETKEPHLNPGIEQALVEELNRLKWNIVTNPATSTAQFVDKKVNVGNTNGKVVLQTFSHESLYLLRDIFQGKIPTALLLWIGTGPDDMPDGKVDTYTKFINIGVDNLAHFIGPSIAGAPNNYPELLYPWQADLIHSSGMKIHPYSFDTEEQMVKYFPYCEGMFTNKAEMTIKFYQDKDLRTGGPDYVDAITVLEQLGY